MLGKEYIADVIYGRKSSPLLEAILLFLSLLYGVAVRLRTFAYAAGLIATKELPCTVISVGNITLGGTGKTPAVIHIAGFLQQSGKRPVVVSRGYGRQGESRTAVVSDGVAVRLDTTTGGDEPVLMARRLPQVPVVVGSDRYAAGTLALDRFRPDAVILDDGFQHIRLARDLNICLVDGADPFGNGRLFPAGILREPLSGLKRAGAVIITRSDQTAGVESLKRTIAADTSAPVFTARYVPRDVVQVSTGRVMPLTSLIGTPVFTFAGIARPRAFEELLRSLGAEVRGLADYPDHHHYSARELEGLLARAKDSGATMLVTTEKDAVRVTGMASRELWALRIELEVIEKDQWEKVLLDSL